MQQLCARRFVEAAHNDFDRRLWIWRLAQKERVAIDGLRGPSLCGRRVGCLELSVGQAMQVHALRPKGPRDAQGVRKSDRELHAEDLPSVRVCDLAFTDSLRRLHDAFRWSSGEFKTSCRM